ncbi:hypothetical protein DYB25_003956 [Aphanomyces astaci]|uniref:Uncharacterized protein n=1 Tax=Aphanomyces astaci TaxID=112090 RepID=A0A397C088_APHAT|nr:hypothetical protein DYB25_003956 [Aphanomyces astaci]
MEDDDCYSFGSYDEIFSHPATACSEHPHGTEDAGESTPGSADVSSQSAILVGTHLLDNGFFVPEEDVTSNESLFHGRHIGLKIKQNGKLLTFNFPPPSTTAESSSIRVCMDSNSRTHALGDFLRIGLEHIHDVLPTKVQNVMLALSISMAVLDITFEFSFMPGPYYKTSKRDDLWNLLKEALLALKAAPPLAAVSTVAHAVNHPDVALLDAPLQHPQPISPTTEAGSSRGFTTSPATTPGPIIPLPSPVRTKSAGVDTTQRNTLIRTYLSMDATSDQAIALAVHLPPVPAALTGEAKLEAEREREARMGEMQQSQADLWNEFARLTQLHFAQVDLIRAAYGQSMDVLTSAAKAAKTKPSKQLASSRRRSMVPAPLDELKENHDANNKKKRKRVSTTTSIPGIVLPPDF